jgi:hypothetical protein
LVSEAELALEDDDELEDNDELEDDMLQDIHK